MTQLQATALCNATRQVAELLRVLEEEEREKASEAHGPRAPRVEARCANRGRRWPRRVRGIFVRMDGVFDRLRKLLRCLKNVSRSF